ncbi:methylenetetrahydrofolate reductase [Bradyrhizobium sp. WSM3983]|uniref:methylenetetrahydrofolate reductase n=1 Tax=Bradyrhizobium sp. WSM3983 TaxID=1038867 RepID=UPI0003F771DB|nr:methylenetetrahydrofolate reductase [Bradyrhizobium sp. WSM3983]
MTVPVKHAGWADNSTTIVDGFSLEMTAKDVLSLREAASHIPRGASVAVTFLAGETFEARLDAIRELRALGFEPMPHLSARRIRSSSEFEGFLVSVASGYRVKQCFVIAGDAAAPEGPYSDSMALLTSGAFERSGISAIGIGGHPEGNPRMSGEQCWTVLQQKCSEIASREMEPFIVTQFAFDAERVLAWLSQLRARGIDAPVRIGVPGPAGIKVLLRFAARCGVAASGAVLAKYGISLTNLFGTAGPEKMINTLAAGLRPEHGPVSLHFYPFGGLAKTANWVSEYARSR